MKILVVGSGFTGCTFARTLKDEGNDVRIIEKMPHIGGLCYTEISSNGFLYEPYGSKVFHTRYRGVRDFVTRFSSFSEYIHRKGIIIKGVLYHYPISYQQVDKLPQKEKILQELASRPPEPDNSNFETCMISQFGETLYRIFIYNYSKKMWGMEPRELKAKWSKNRVELKKEDTDTFEGQWQGLPVKGYTEFFKKMTEDIPINYRQADFKNNDYDLVIYTGKIDELNDYKYGHLPYKSSEYNYIENDKWECDRYGTINLPDHSSYIRKANFKVLYNVDSEADWVQYQRPVSHNGHNTPMYPVYTDSNIALFHKYLHETCCLDNIVPAGRLGLYNYLNMDRAVKLAMEMKDLVKGWRKLSHKDRSSNIIRLIGV